MAEGINWGSIATQAAPALGTLLGGASQAVDIEANSDAIISQMESESKSFAFSQEASDSQMKELDRAVGDKMTERGMSALQAESRLRAASAETGTAGGTTENVIKDVYMQQTLDNAVTIRNARTSKVSMLRKAQADKLGFNNRMESLASGISSPLQSGLSTANAGLQGYNGGMNMLNQSQRTEFYSLGGQESNNTQYGF